ncbi:hypothetical protein BGZ46_001157 [Entomortierella lignicola]|nr:hypothetical protein BGZ46_001157 [Entomortierella lignicola]
MSNPFTYATDFDNLSGQLHFDSFRSEREIALSETLRANTTLTTLDLHQLDTTNFLEWPAFDELKEPDRHSFVLGLIKSMEMKSRNQKKAVYRAT